MREIKFRAWDYGKKIFLPTKTYAVLNDKEFGAIGVMLSDFENYQQGEYLYPHSQVLNQFTGLKDKNEVDIYEGDILKGESNHYLYGDKSDVYFLDGSFCISIQYDMTPMELSGCKTIYQNKIQGKPHEEIMKLYDEYKDKISELYEFEVIGNIYENPELLKN